jgi:hypothetical protein
VNLQLSREEITMRTERTRMVMRTGAALYLSVTAFPGGVASEGIRFDREGTAELQSHDEAVPHWRRLLMAGEEQAATGRGAIESNQGVR